MKLSNDFSISTLPLKNEIIPDIKNEFNSHSKNESNSYSNLKKIECSPNIKSENIPIIKCDKFKLLENIPKIHAFEIPKENKKEKDSPLRPKKETLSKFRRNPYFVIFFHLFFKINNVFIFRISLIWLVSYFFHNLL